MCVIKELDISRPSHIGSHHRCPNPSDNLSIKESRSSQNHRNLSKCHLPGPCMPTGTRSSILVRCGHILQLFRSHLEPIDAQSLCYHLPTGVSWCPTRCCLRRKALSVLHTNY